MVSQYLLCYKSEGFGLTASGTTSVRPLYVSALGKIFEESGPGMLKGPLKNIQDWSEHVEREDHEEPE
jgi:hypothetical protein